MRFVPFPHPTTASEDGVVAVGGALTEDFLVSAYEQGIFPWPHEGYPLLWFSPWERGVIEFKNVRRPDSFKKLCRRVPWRMTTNQAFSQVIKACATVKRADQAGTWITEELMKAYEKLHQRGLAHSLEVWDGDELVGGIYGVFVAQYFSAESMFFKKSNASKWALWQLINHLERLGLTWLDIQMVTPVTESFGGQLISQGAFLEKLSQARLIPLKGTF